MEVIEYDSATSMAGKFQQAMGRIETLLEQLEQEERVLQDTFNDGYGFRLDLYVDGSHEDNNAQTRDSIKHKFKLRAWSALFTKLGIWKIMSSKRAAGLRKQLEGRPRYSHDEPVDELPDITADSIVAVLSGMVLSADEFLCEAVGEEYEFWRSGRRELKTNAACDWGLPRKVIRGYMVAYSSHSGWRETYSDQGQHLRALDNLFHALDEVGFPAGYNGPLVDAIRSCGQDGVGETDYFSFRCYHNGNIHLTFKRKDLLDRFNQIAGKNRLAGTRRNGL